MKPKYVLTNQRGLTLLELLFTLGIVAILFSLALPAYATFIKRSNSLTISYELVGLVHYARMEALNRKEVVTLCGSSDGKRCTNDWSTSILIFTDINGDGTVDTEDTLLRTASSLKKGETLTWRSFRNKPYLQLQPNGMTYFQNGNFTYCPDDGDAQFALHWIINVAGNLRIAQDKNHNGILEKADGKDISCVM
jgi:type IV fimbrial biogenesis protein FimT